MARGDLVAQHILSMRKEGLALTRSTLGNNGKGQCMPLTIKQSLFTGARNMTQLSYVDLAEDVDPVPSTHVAARHRVHNHPTF